MFHKFITKLSLHLIVLALVPLSVTMAQTPPALPRIDGNFKTDLDASLTFLNNRAALIVETSTVTVVNTLTETSLFSMTIPANTMTTTTGLQVNF